MKKVNIIRVESHTPEWHKFRESGIGGSENGSVMNMNSWTPALILFHEKVGIKPVFNKPVEKMFHGRNHEDYVADLWRYWDGTKEGMMKNHDAGNIVRECRRVNGYAVNPEYPWLFASVDRLINQNQVSLYSGEICPDNQVLECKTIGENAAAYWKDGLPPTWYTTQVQQYMLIYGLQYAELAVLKGGNDYDVFPIIASDAIQQDIIQKTKDFWDRVLTAREHKALYDAGQITYQEFETVLQQLEPEPDNTEAYKNYISDRYTKERNDMMADDADIELVKEQHILKLMIDALSGQRDLKKNQLTKKIVDNKVETLEMASMGYARYYMRKGGKHHQLDIRLKDTAECEAVAARLLKQMGL